MADIRIELQGADESLRLINRLLAHFPNTVGKAVHEEAIDTMKASLRECPIDTGALRASSYVGNPTITRDNVSVALGYGGQHAQTNPKTGLSTNEYTIKVHEASNSINFKTAGTKRKFLEDPIKRRVQTLLSRLNTKILTFLLTGRW